MLSNITKGLLFYCPMRLGQKLFFEKRRGTVPQRGPRRAARPHRGSHRFKDLPRLVLNKAAKLLCRPARDAGLVVNLAVVFSNTKTKYPSVWARATMLE